MTITPLFIYGINLLDGICNVFVIISIGSFLIFLLTFEDVDGDFSVKLILSTIIFATLAFFIPSTSQIYEMYLIPKIANSQITQQIPVAIQKYINDYIKENK